jgi:hypothetical protein
MFELMISGNRSDWRVVIAAGLLVIHSSIQTCKASTYV